MRLEKHRSARSPRVSPVYGMPVIVPGDAVDYKMKIVPPDPSVDFKLVIKDPRPELEPESAKPPR